MAVRNNATARRALVVLSSSAVVQAAAYDWLRYSGIRRIDPEKKPNLIHLACSAYVFLLDERWEQQKLVLD